MRRCVRVWAWLLQCALLLLINPAVATAAETVLSAPSDSAWVDAGVEILYERDGERLTREQATAPAAQPRWTAYEGKKVNLSHPSAPVWLRFTVHNQNAASDDWVLAIDWPQLHTVELHRFDPDTAIWREPVRAAMGEPVGAGAARDPNYRFELPLELGRRATLLLRVEADQYTVPLRLWQREALMAKRVHDAVFIGALFGVLIVMLLYNASLLIFTRDRSYLDYSAYLMAVILFEAAATGYDRVYLWSASRWWQLHAFHLFGCLTFLAAAVFIRRFLDLERARPHLNRINQALIAFWLVQIPLLLVLPAHLVDPLSRSVGLFEALAVIYTSVFLLAQGHHAARYFAIAWVTIAVASIAASLFSLGLIDGGWLVENAQHVGFVVETVLLSIALADRIKRERQLKEAAQRNAHEMTLRMEAEREQKIVAQERALAVQQQANEQLEQRVHERTAELNQAMQELALANSELAKLSVTDALTKVHNRRYFNDVLRSEYERSIRNLLPLTLVMIDIDHFKRINDTVGHVGGDECLKLVAATLAASVGRLNDLVARYGGEEFAVILPSTPPDKVPAITERMRAAVAAIRFIHRGQPVPLSISLGAVSAVPDETLGIDAFVCRADEALYVAKRNGRNRVQIVVDSPAPAGVAG